MKVSIDFGKINNSETFHDVFSHAMGFPDFYGRNMDAWIDCMSYVNHPKEKMSQITIKSGESLDMLIYDLEDAFNKCPDVVREFFICTAFVNKRLEEDKTNNTLKIIPL